VTPKALLFGCTAALLLGACATVPTGPSVMVLPAPPNPSTSSRLTNGCRHWALHAAGITTKKAATDTMVTGAAVAPRSCGAGAALGAAAGNPRSAPPPARASGSSAARRSPAGYADANVNSVQRRTTSATCSACMQGQPDPRVAWLGAVLPSGGDEHAASSATAPAMTTHAGIGAPRPR